MPDVGQGFGKTALTGLQLGEIGGLSFQGSQARPIGTARIPLIRMSVTRGCPFGCSFCQVESISGKKVRSRDPADIVTELIYYRDRYNLQSILFDDDQILGKRSFFTQLLEEMIRRELNLKFIIGAFAIFLVTDEQLALLAKAGCVGVNVAIETGNERVLREIVKKPVRLQEVPAKIRLIKELGMFCLANFIIGFPGETWEEIRETIAYAEKCGADYLKFFAAVPLKNTKLWDMMIAANAYDGNVDEYQVEWRFSQIRSDEWAPEEISILRAYEWDRINFETPEKRKRIAELWKVSENEMFAIRKETRDALLRSL